MVLRSSCRFHGVFGAVGPVVVQIAFRRNVKKVRSELRNCKKQAARKGPERRSSEKLQGPCARLLCESLYGRSMRGAPCNLRLLLW